MPFPFRKKCPSPPPPPSSPSPHHRSPSFWAFSRRQWLTFCTLSLANLCTSTTFSCIVPFFPTEVRFSCLTLRFARKLIGPNFRGKIEKKNSNSFTIFGLWHSFRFLSQKAKLKGLSTAEVGLIIGVFQLTMFCASPVLGKLVGNIFGSLFGFALITRTSPTIRCPGSAPTGCSSPDWPCAVSDQCSMGTSSPFPFSFRSLLPLTDHFSLLKFLPSPNSFFSAAILMRCATALGNAAFRTSSLTLIARHFPDHISSVMVLLPIWINLNSYNYPTGSEFDHHVRRLHGRAHHRQRTL